MKILVFDNYDSFTYNLVHLVEKITNVKPDVCRNDAISIEDASKYDKIILSPGPGIPSEAGLLLPMIKALASTKCAKLINLSQVYHGVATTMSQTKNTSLLFKNLPQQFEAGRYHSWIVDAATLSDEFEVTAVDENNFVMAMQHKTFDLQSVQFHPESVLTPQGETILSNWINK